MSQPTTARQLVDNLTRVIRGKTERITDLAVAVLAGGHVLIEDVPGVGKTTLARALAMSVGGEFKRIQFTPDLLPTDILGGSIYRPADGSFEIRRGPIFAHVVLADEINRASPRTQSALLEAMSEHTVTLDGSVFQLPDPFMVVATQNPIEFHGTYPLPEAQLDRFLIRLELGYPPPEEEVAMLYQQQLSLPVDSVRAITSPEELKRLREEVCRVTVASPVATYITMLVQATRNDPRCDLGASPRGSLGLFRTAQASAYLDGRDHATPDDVQRMAVAVLAHRLVLETKARYAGTEKSVIITDALEQVEVPV